MLLDLVLIIIVVGFLKALILFVINKVLLPRPKLWLGERYCFSRVSLSVCYHDKSKSSRLISVKFGRKLAYYQRKVKFDVEKNRSDRTQTSSKRNFQNAISQKVLDRFRWQLTGSFVIKKERSSSNLTRIALIERKPRPIFQNHTFPGVRV